MTNHKIRAYCRMKKWYYLIFAAAFLAFWIFVGFPPTSEKHRPAYLRLDKENMETNVVTWVGRAQQYEVISYRSIFVGGGYQFVDEEFYVVSEPRFEEGNLLEGLSYQYRVRGLDEGGAPISPWSRSVKRMLDLRGNLPNYFSNPPTPVPDQ